MEKLVQRIIVHTDEEDGSPILPMDAVLVNEDGTPFEGGGAAPGNATTSTAGLVKKASATAAVSAADATAAAAETVTKEEFDALVALANANKAAINDLISKAKTAGQMA